MVTMASLLAKLLNLLFNTGDNSCLYHTLEDFLLEKIDGSELFLEFAEQQIKEDFTLEEVIKEIDEDKYILMPYERKQLKSYLTELYEG